VLISGKLPKMDRSRMLLRSLFTRGHIESAAHDLYKAAVTQARQEGFYLSLDVPDSVDGRFDLLTLHVFLLLHRLGEGGRQAKVLSQAVFDLMFTDMDGNLREMGVSDLAVGGRVKTMAKAFYGRIGAYEPGLQSEGGDLSVLKEALLRNLYRGVATDDRVLTAMALYIRRENTALTAQSLKDLGDGKVFFGAPLMPEQVPS
jgi:cytochrome b pre-mRNA-processing protein 3